MKLFKWNSDIVPKFPNIIEKFWGKNIRDNIADHENIATVPSVNISDEEKAFELNLALPGFDKKDIKIEIENNCLILTSEKQYENSEKHKNWMRQEYSYSSFKRSFELPEGADSERVKAEMKNGILSILVGKKKGYISNSKKILVQ